MKPPNPQALDTLRQRVRAVKERFPKGRTALIQALHEARWLFHWIPPEAVAVIAEELGVHAAEVREVGSFYQYFKFEPVVGRYHFRICTNITCMVNGAYNLLEHLKGRLGIGPGEVTGDGRFSIEEVECIGCGDRSPAILINDTRFEGVTPEVLDDLIDRALKDELDA